MTTNRSRRALNIFGKSLIAAALFAAMSVLAFTAAAATGEEIYQQQCSSCHGATGAGNGPQAGQDGVTAPRPLSQTVTERMVVEKALMLGVNDVPGHRNAPLLSPQELQQLIDYVNRLAHP